MEGAPGGIRPGIWTWDLAIARRLRRGRLLDRASGEDAVDVVRSMCGAQAQVPAAAELCIGVRADGLTRARLRELVEDERLLTRTYAMRDTVHLLPSDELPLYLAAMRRLHGGEDRWFTRFGLDAGRAESLFAAVADAQDGRPLTRHELAAELRRAPVGGWVFDLFDLTLAGLSVAAAHAGVLASG